MSGSSSGGSPRRESAVDEIEGVIADTITSHYNQKNTKGRVLSICLQLILLVGVVTGFVLVFQYFPAFSETLQGWATWANETGPYGLLVFAGLASLLILIPGVPGSLLCVTCGAVFPFWKGLFVAIVGHHAGACMSFMLARRVCLSHIRELIFRRPGFQAFSVAARVEQWKVTFLSRFVVMPVQIKNYGFGLLPVTFKCFFFMAFLGDLQSVLFSVYLGSLSQELLDHSSSSTPGNVGKTKQFLDEEASAAFHKKVVSIIGLAVAILMTTCASIVARRAYLNVVGDQNNDGEDVGLMMDGLVGSTSSPSPSSVRNSPSNGSTGVMGTASAAKRKMRNSDASDADHELVGLLTHSS